MTGSDVVQKERSERAKEKGVGWRRKEDRRPRRGFGCDGEVGWCLVLMATLIKPGSSPEPVQFQISPTLPLPVRPAFPSFPCKKKKKRPLATEEKIFHVGYTDKITRSPPSNSKSCKSMQLTDTAYMNWKVKRTTKMDLKKWLGSMGRGTNL